ncbi:MAG: hypothetical protein J2P54_00220 [Bradyrhizobiaceae bacterium]|nr:hypothetical protein [Bradyrhizobiaceae bacterium]
MQTELWGTFSVRDHLRDRPFVTEVLVYDRLMIPRPPTLEEEPLEPGEVEDAKWPDEWNPQRLREMLNILQEGDLAVELPWGKQARQDWAKLYHGHDLDELGAKRTKLAEDAKHQVEIAKMNMPDQAPFIATGGLIAMYTTNAAHNDVAKRIVNLARKPGVEIEPVIAYSSYDAFQQEQHLRQADPNCPADDLSPYALFGWEFFVPENTEKTDHEMLRAAVKLASRKDFREMRQSFHGWLKKMHDGSHDPEEARQEMLKMLGEYRNFLSGTGFKNAVRYAAKVVPVLAPLTGLLGGNVADIAVGVAASGASLLVEKLFPEKAPEDRIQCAAMVCEAKRFFGKK